MDKKERKDVRKSVHLYKSTRQSGTACSVRGCHNNQRKLNERLWTQCFDHRLMRKDCSCDRPFKFYKPENENVLQQWNAKLGLKKPPKALHVCSFHFIDKKPTLQNPLPELYLGYDYDIKTSRISTENVPNDLKYSRVTSIVSDKLNQTGSNAAKKEKITCTAAIGQEHNDAKDEKGSLFRMKQCLKTVAVPRIFAGSKPGSESFRVGGAIRRTRCEKKKEPKRVLYLTLKSNNKHFVDGWQNPDPINAPPDDRPFNKRKIPARRSDSPNQKLTKMDAAHVLHKQQYGLSEPKRETEDVIETSEIKTETSELKIEIDVAEDPSLPWTTERRVQKPLQDCAEEEVTPGALKRLKLETQPVSNSPGGAQSVIEKIDGISVLDTVITADSKNTVALPSALKREITVKKGNKITIITAFMRPL